MRALFRFRWLLALALGLGSQLAAHATHTQGGEIMYSVVPSTTAGVPRYHVVVRLFLNPNSPAKQETIELAATRGGCDATGANLVQVTIKKETDTPGNQLRCIGSGGFYHTSLYQTDLDLPAGQWQLSVMLENRISNIQNINGGNSIGLTAFLIASLNSAIPNSSPRFESVLMPMLTTRADQRYSFSAFDIDGDSLVYNYAAPQSRAITAQALETCGAPVPNSLPSPNFQLDTRSGALTATAATTGQEGFFNATVLVSEFRRLNGEWQLIGTTTRDLLYVVQAGTNAVPTFTSLRVNGGASQSPDLPLLVRPGQTLTLTLSARDADAGQQLRFTTEAVNVVPGLTLATLSGTQAQLTWQVPATLPPGRYRIPVAVLDDNCTYNAAEDRTLTIVVSPSAPPMALAARASLNAEHEVYPTPFREQVQFRAAPNQLVQVVDVLGRPVAQLRSGDDGRVQWQPGAGVAPGLYLARAAADGQPLARLLRAE